MTETTGMGFAHFIAQSDVLGKSLLAILIVMSVASWAIIAIKGVSLTARKARSNSFLNFFWNATSLDAVAGEISTHGARDPFSHLTAHAMQAQAHHAKYGAAKLDFGSRISSDLGERVGEHGHQNRKEECVTQESKGDHEHGA